jgi:hypothetical protein
MKNFLMAAVAVVSLGMTGAAIASEPMLHHGVSPQARNETVLPNQRPTYLARDEEVSPQERPAYLSRNETVQPNQRPTYLARNEQVSPQQRPAYLAA